MECFNLACFFLTRSEQSLQVIGNHKENTLVFVRYVNKISNR